jgi:putative tricarboxylic transport membrane protein
MDAFTSLIEGFGTALTPENLLYAFIGVLLGTAIGVLPGIGPAMTVALLLPLTRGLDVTSALIMFAGIYYGGMYGGSTTSILLNTPGESASVVTAVEGNKMAKAGRAAQALASSTASAVPPRIRSVPLLPDCSVAMPRAWAKRPRLPTSA